MGDKKSKNKKQEKPPMKDNGPKDKSKAKKKK